MAIQRILAQMTVAELDIAEPWYTALFGREPDARPMAGLLEWHLDERFGVQVWVEPGRSGNSSMVLDESDLDARAAELDRVGISNDGPVAATTTRILPVSDPDGNRIVFTGPFV